VRISEVALGFLPTASMKGTQVRLDSVREPQTGQFINTSALKGHLFCKCCGSQRVFRVFREGFLKERVYPMFGFYPWKCRVCGACIILHKRERSKAEATSPDGRSVRPVP